MAKLSMPEMAQRVLDGLGGVANVAELNHCATRLRVNVNKAEDVNVEALKKVPGVMGVELAGTYCQVIVGGIIEDLYLAVGKLAGPVGNEQGGGGHPKDKAQARRGLP